MWPGRHRQNLALRETVCPAELPPMPLPRLARCPGTPRSVPDLDPRSSAPRSRIAMSMPTHCGQTTIDAAIDTVLVACFVIRLSMCRDAIAQPHIVAMLPFFIIIYMSQWGIPIKMWVDRFRFRRTADAAAASGSLPLFPRRSAAVGRSRAFVVVAGSAIRQSPRSLRQRVPRPCGS
jgi:hypothetical protein